MDPPDTKGKKDGGKKGAWGRSWPPPAPPGSASASSTRAPLRRHGRDGRLPRGPHPGPRPALHGAQPAPAARPKHQITRVAVTDDKDMEKNNTMSDGNGARSCATRPTASRAPRRARAPRPGVVRTTWRSSSPPCSGAGARPRQRPWRHGCRGIWLAVHDTEDGAATPPTFTPRSGGHPAGRRVVVRGECDPAGGPAGVSWYTFGWDGLQLVPAPAPPPNVPTRPRAHRPA